MNRGRVRALDEKEGWKTPHGAVTKEAMVSADEPWPGCSEHSRCFFSAAPLLCCSVDTPATPAIAANTACGEVPSPSTRLKGWL